MLKYVLSERVVLHLSFQDAEGNKIKQMLAKNLESGMMTGKLELSDQPVLGEWTMTVKTDQVRYVKYLH